jgi:AraC family transcriptional regulator of adaptative response / DNA-3-methyladenine glycosylase II
MVRTMANPDATTVLDADELLQDAAACYRVLQARDARFDGRLFVAVRTTGIYCRPICPARTPKPSSCRFFATAAAAQEAGFRPCLRCRPEVSPELATWRGTSSTVTRALALIREGALDGDDASVDRLAERLGVGERQLRRLFRTHLGASPVAVAQTRRVLFAKHLLHETRLPMVQVALAAGFGSVRRFNEIFRTLFGRAPRALRREAARAAETSASIPGAAVELRLPFAAPYDWQAMLAFLGARAIPGVEQVADGVYRRTLAIGAVHGTVAVTPCKDRNALRVAIRVADVAVLSEVVACVRRVFDLAADPRAIAALLARDPLLAPLVAARPGLRVPGGWSGFELAVRAILGQQVSVAGARTLAARLVARYGEPLVEGVGDSGLTHVFPSPARLADLDPTTLGVPRSRAEALRALARAARDDAGLFGTAQSLESAIARLRALPGVGEWTAQYVALRALREPDAFPADDLGLQRALADADGRRPGAAELLARAEAWRPWRAYAAQHLWTSDAAVVAQRRTAPRGEKRHAVKQSFAAHPAALSPHDADRRPRAAAGR